MLTNGHTNNRLGLLEAMDDTFRDRNDEQTSAALLHAYQQFKGENLSSFSPRFQHILTRSP